MKRILRPPPSFAQSLPGAKRTDPRLESMSEPPKSQLRTKPPSFAFETTDALALVFKIIKAARLPCYCLGRGEQTSTPQPLDEFLCADGSIRNKYVLFSVRHSSGFESFDESSVDRHAYGVGPYPGW